MLTRRKTIGCPIKAKTNEVWSGKTGFDYLGDIERQISNFVLKSCCGVYYSATTGKQVLSSDSLKAQRRI